MIKNDPEIQKFLDSAKAEAAATAEDTSIITFDEFWSDKYSANDMNFNSAAFLSDVSVLMAHNQVTYYKDLSSFRKGISILVLPVKKVIRKLVAFLFLDTIAQQNEINLSMVRIMTHMRGYVNRNNSPYNEVLSKEQVLERCIREQKEQINSLSSQVAELTAKIEAMEKEAEK